jgi:hypothetical protein
MHWLHSLHFGWLHSLHFGDVPAYLSAAIAVFFGVVSLRSSRRSKKAEKAATNQAVKATEAAQDAAAAQRQIAEDTRRFATAQETHTALLQDAAEQAERFPWDIHRQGDSMDFRLVNRTNTRKYQVVVTGEPAGRPAGVFRMGGGGDNQFDFVDGRETVELDLFVAAQTIDRSVT